MRRAAAAGAVVGLIPAAGVGSRIGHLPCSKEIYPVGFDGLRPKAAVSYLLEALAAAGVATAYLVLRRGKWDIPAHLAAVGTPAGLDLAYLVTEDSPSVPFTLDRAYPFVAGRRVALGFPDILLGTADPFAPLIERVGGARCEVALGLFPCDRPDKADLVHVDPRGRVRDIVVKPGRSRLRLTWGAAVWGPAMTEFLHAAVGRRRPSRIRARELHVGDLIRAALRAGLRVEGVQVADRPFRDIGTPEDLLEAARRLMPPPAATGPARGPKAERRRAV